METDTTYIHALTHQLSTARARHPDASEPQRASASDRCLRGWGHAQAYWGTATAK